MWLSVLTRHGPAKPGSDLGQTRLLCLFGTVGSTVGHQLYHFQFDSEAV